MTDALPETAPFAPPHDPAERSAVQTSPVGWGLYLGMSWTWVIGMFLPVLLIRDYGTTAWWLFAIPNCVGAAAMGWVLRTQGQSRALVERHLWACRVFSLVTIAFQLFFCVWMLPRLIGPFGWITAAVVVQIAFTPLVRRRAPLLAAGVFVVSVGIAIFMLATHRLLPAERVVMSLPDAVGLALVCLLGFGLCPYLDLTFHHARQQTSDAGAKIAFGTGFCGFFAAMIVFTLLYATTFLVLTAYTGVASAWLLAVHLSVQVVFTVLVHARVLQDDAEQRGDLPMTRAGLGAALALGLCAGMIAYYFASHQQLYAGLTVGEVLYRCFMACYGLLFPAYMMVSFVSGRPRWVWTAIASVVALPFYYIGFIERHMAWVSAGVVIVLLAGLAAAVVSRRQSLLSEA